MIEGDVGIDQIVVAAEDDHFTPLALAAGVVDGFGAAIIKGVFLDHCDTGRDQQHVAPNVSEGVGGNDLGAGSDGGGGYPTGTAQQLGAVLAIQDAVHRGKCGMLFGHQNGLQIIAVAIQGVGKGGHAVGQGQPVQPPAGLEGGFFQRGDAFGQDQRFQRRGTAKQGGAVLGKQQPLLGGEHLVFGRYRDGGQPIAVQEHLVHDIGHAGGQFHGRKLAALKGVGADDLDTFGHGHRAGETGRAAHQSAAAGIAQHTLPAAEAFVCFVHQKGGHAGVGKGLG